MTNKKALLKKFGSEEAISEYYRSLQQKSMLNPNKQKGNFKGGLYKNPQLAKEIGDKGRKAQSELRNRTQDTEVKDKDA